MVERQRGEKEGESYNGSQEDAERAQGDRGPGAGGGGRGVGFRQKLAPRVCPAAAE